MTQSRIDKIIANGRGQLTSARQLLADKDFDINELFRLMCAAENVFDDVEIWSRYQRNKEIAFANRKAKEVNDLIIYANKADRKTEEWQQKFQTVKWIVDEHKHNKTTDSTASKEEHE